MQAGEAFWLDRDDVLEAKIVDMLPARLRNRLAAVVTSRVKAQGSGGGGVKSSIMKEWERTDGPWTFAWRYALEEKIGAEECAKKATEAVEKLGAVTKKFREEVKNDTSSMKAASNRVQTEVSQMVAQYTTALALLNSAEFAGAIENAERMATALEKISGLSETKLSVAVFSGGKGA